MGRKQTGKNFKLLYFAAEFQKALRLEMCCWGTIDLSLYFFALKQTKVFNKFNFLFEVNF